MQRFQDLGCTRYRESEIVTHKRIAGSTFLVTVGEAIYIEVKAKFVQAGEKPGNGFLEFTEQIMDLYRLKDCPSITKLRGIVLDDEYKHLKGYVRDYTVHNLTLYSHSAFLSGTQIPLSLKVRWMRQLAECFAWTHSHGFILGSFTLATSVDGNLMIRPWKRLPTLPNLFSDWYPQAKISHVHSPSNDDFRLDVHRLGQRLWSISEMKWGLPAGCDLAGCTTRPRYTCKVKHVRWDSVPFSAETDAEIRTIIQQSLSMDSKIQSTAQEIVHRLRKYATELSTESTIHEFLRIHGSLVLPPYERIRSCCEECFSDCTLSYYHCHICHDGDFDLCTSCVTSGVHCWDSSHKMALRKISEFGIIEDEM